MFISSITHGLHVAARPLPHTRPHTSLSSVSTATEKYINVVRLPSVKHLNYGLEKIK